MARSRTSNRGRSSAPRRRLFWARYTDTQAYTGTGGAQTATISNILAPFETAYGADLFGFTVTRIVGHFKYAADVTGTAGTQMRFSTGIRIEDQSNTSGLTDAQQLSLLPINDPFADWMFVRNTDSLAGGTAAVGTNFETSRFDLDLRSQRRLDELGRSLYLFAGTNTTLGGRISWDLNVLCKRP